MLLELLSDGAVKVVTVGSCCNCLVCFFDSFIKRHCVGSIVVGRLIRYYSTCYYTTQHCNYYYYYVVVVVVVVVSVTGLFSPVLLLLNQR